MKRLTYPILAMLLASSCGKQAAPEVVCLVPQIVSTEVVPASDAVELFASVSGSTHFTDCGFGLIRDGLIREFSSTLNEETMSFSVHTGGLSADSEYGFYAFLANGTARIQTPARSFRTLPGEETPTTPGPSVSFTEAGVTPGTTSAFLNATLSGTEEVEEVGFALSADGERFTRKTVSLSGKGFSLTWEGLQDNTDYSFYAWAVQRGITVTSPIQSFRTQKETHTASFVSLDARTEAFSVTLSAQITDGTYVESCGFGLSREGRTAVEYGTPLDGDRFTVRIEDLQPDTDYTWYAFFLIDGQRTTSAFQRFRTPEDPSLKFLDIKARADIHSVALEARLSRTEGILSCGFAIRGSGGDFTRYPADLQSNGYISLTIEGLEAETLYNFYVWARTEEGEVVSETLAFTTLQEEHGEVRFLSVSAQAGAGSAQLSATLNKTDGISECGFGLSSNQHDYIEYSAALSGETFEKTINGLDSNTTYYFYAYFILDGRTYQSSPSSFTTSYE